nr:gypsy/Ty3 retroelement polyprotein [Tanacetum cinerariifolium]
MCSGQLYALKVVIDKLEYNEGGENVNLVEQFMEEAKLDEEVLQDSTLQMMEAGPQISVNALSGVKSYRTMRIKGYVGKQANVLFDKHSKFAFVLEKAEYLGHLISKEGVSTDPSKITAIKDWPTPNNVKQLRGFLEAMVSTPVLALPNFNKEFVVETDVCDGGFRAVLTQDGQPVAYMSKALAPKQQTLSTYEKEFVGNQSLYHFIHRFESKN